jgi:hypothetical protein
VIPVAQWGAQEILYPYAKKPRLFPRHTVHAKVGDPVDLDDLRELPLTPENLRIATDRIMDAITVLLAEIRQEPPPAERFDPRRSGVRLTGNPHARAEAERAARRQLRRRSR